MNSKAVEHHATLTLQPEKLLMDIDLLAMHENAHCQIQKVYFGDTNLTLETLESSIPVVLSVTQLNLRH